MTRLQKQWVLSVVVGGLSIGVALAILWALYVQWQRFESELATSRSTAPVETLVLISAREIPLGRNIQPDDLTTILLRSEYVSPSALLDPEDIVGRVARERILSHELIREERLTDKGGVDLGAVISSGMRGESLNLPYANVVSGFLLPGNRVDVIVTVLDDVTGEVAETRTLVQGVRVLAVDDRRGESEETGTRLKPQVTLELLPADAEKLTHGLRTAVVRLALRGDIDFSSFGERGVTTSDLLGGTPGSERVTVKEWIASRERAPTTLVLIRGDESILVP